MENTGTWNSDLALIFFACLFTPIALYFVFGCIQKITETTDIPSLDCPQESTHVVSLDNKKSAWEYIKQDAMERAVNGDAKSRDWLTKNVFNSEDIALAPSVSQKPHRSTSSKPVDTGTPKDIRQEAIMALQGMGFNKTDAKNKINELCSKKKYNSSESLITESFA